LTERFDRFDYSQKKHMTFEEVKSDKNIRHKIAELSTTFSGFEFNEKNDKSKVVTQHSGFEFNK